MKQPTIAVLALCLFASPVLAEETPKGPPPHGEHGGPGEHGKRGEHFFNKADMDTDGKISRDEFRAKGDKMFDEADANRDGFITREEGKAAHEARRAKWQARKAEYMAKRGAEKPAKPE